MEVFLTWAVLGLWITGILAGIWQIGQISRKHAAEAAEIERRRPEWLRELEQVRQSRLVPFGSEKAERPGFRLVD
jgi:hypothetical protein